MAAKTQQAQRAWKKLDDDVRRHAIMPDVWATGCWLWERDVDAEGYAVMPTRALGVKRVIDVLRLRRHGHLPPKSKTLVHDAGCPRHCVNPFHTNLVPVHRACNTSAVCPRPRKSACERADDEPASAEEPARSCGAPADADGDAGEVARGTVDDAV